MTVDIAKIEAIFWDFNGTLLDDVEVSVRAMNRLLIKRDYPQLSVDRYKSIFTFPVQDYYVAAGVDFNRHDWEVVAMEFISNYRREVVDVKLQPFAKEALIHFSKRNIRQFILSAMEQEFLNETVGRCRINHFFERIAGLNDHYAVTKSDTARELIKTTALPPERICLIGDTIHDYEVAVETGIRCVLVANGHQNRKRLGKTGCLVLDDLSELGQFFG